ncbi:hypothetical protein Tco_0511319 [Tanacetum coccineum]
MVVIVVVKNVAVVMVVVENIVVEYFLDSQNFGSRKEDTVVMVVVVDDTPIVIDKLVRVTFAFQKEDTVARKNLSFVNLGMSSSSLSPEMTITSSQFWMTNLDQKTNWYWVRDWERDEDANLNSHLLAVLDISGGCHAYQGASSRLCSCFCFFVVKDVSGMEASIWMVVKEIEGGLLEEIKVSYFEKQVMILE